MCVYNRVELFAEDQPNAQGQVHDNEEDDARYITVCDGEGMWQVVSDDLHETR